MSSHDDSPVGRLSRALAAAAPPKAVLDALAGKPPEVESGQLWQARRGNRSMLVLISAEDGATVEVSPVTIDEVSDSDSVDLSPETSVLEAPLTVWLGLTRWLPMRTLEQYTGDLTIDCPGDGVLAAIARAGRTGEAAVSPADPKVVFRAGMVDTLDELAATPLPSGTGELAGILRNAELGVQELGALLDVPGSVVLELRRGRRALSAEEAARLASAVGRDAEQLLGANPTPPEPLLMWMSRPAQRRKVIALAKMKDLDEDTAFSHATFSTFALAARTSGDRYAESAWAALGQRYFQSVLDES